MPRSASCWAIESSQIDRLFGSEAATRRFFYMPSRRIAPFLTDVLRRMLVYVACKTAASRTVVGFRSWSGSDRGRLCCRGLPWVAMAIALVVPVVGVGFIAEG